jgi:DNA helicase-2/ATP-dependent DNA helicase PcrA
VRPEILLGPPGCGKTHSLLVEVESELARGTDPRRIGFFSFTRRAATEAATRAAEKFSLSRSDLPYFQTIHSLCFRRLGLERGDVLEADRLRDFGRWIGVDVRARLIGGEEGTAGGSAVGDRILFMENLSRVRGIPLRQQYDENDDDLRWETVERVARGLEAYKRHHHLVDYTDMLRMYLDRGQGLGLDVLIVDESQDLSWLQWEVVEMLAQGCRRVVVAGDDDQAIYHWAGADVERFVGMSGDVRVLGQSWRVPRAPQRVADEIISRVSHRREKEWAPRNEEGAVVRAHSFDEASTEGEDVLVLARNTYVIDDQVLPVLRRAGIVYEYRGHSSVRASVLRGVTAWEALRAGRVVPVEDARAAYELLAAGSGVARGHKTLPAFADDAEVTMGDLQERGGLLTTAIWHEAMERMPREELAYLLSARRRGERLRARPRVRVSTIHGAKGGQAEHVVLLTDMARRTWHEAQDNPEDEARVWYVAVTRARQQLTIVSPKSSMWYDV